MFSRQCVLTRKTTSGVQEYVAWIPEKFAVKGKVVKVRDDDQDWDDGWKVAAVGERRMKTQEANERSRDHLKHRETTDV